MSDMRKNKVLIYVHMNLYTKIILIVLIQTDLCISKRIVYTDEKLIAVKSEMSVLFFNFMPFLRTQQLCAFRVAICTGNNTQK